MDVVATWTGRHASALRQALRLTNEGFADQLGTATRTVAKWNAEPDLILTTELQRALDTALTRASADAQARFGLLVDDADSRPDSSELRSEQTVAALGWLDGVAGWHPGTSRTRVSQRLHGIDPTRVNQKRSARSGLPRDALAAALNTYYGHSGSLTAACATCNGSPVITSVLTKPNWRDLRLPLGVGRDVFTLTSGELAPPALDPAGTNAAIDRIATVAATGVRMVDMPLYRLRDFSVGAEAITAQVGLARFLDYALTVDLLEAEIADAIIDGTPLRSGSLPLRDRYLPSIESVLEVDQRICAGGTLALFAVARPASRSQPKPDYLILIQERGPQVLNASSRLAVIPKSFHSPLVDYREDAQIWRTLEREMEEELFGRTDVDTVFTQQRSADPMHPSRQSKPMRWLTDHPESSAWSMECTGFGFNLISGNYEVPSLIAVHDEAWWSEFGGEIEANWESGNIRRYSTLDTSAIDALIQDPSWSSEGLFALLLGIRRLSEIGDNRVRLPSIDWTASER